MCVCDCTLRKKSIWLRETPHMVSVTLRMSGVRWPLTDGSRTLSRRRSLGWKRILFVLVGFFIYFYFFCLLDTH